MRRVTEKNISLIHIIKYPFYNIFFYLCNQIVDKEIGERSYIVLKTIHRLTRDEQGGFLCQHHRDKLNTNFSG